MQYARLGVPFHSVSDDELLRHCENIKGASPLIDELAKRLAHCTESGTNAEAVQCPTCARPSSLTVQAEGEGQDLNVKVEVANG